MALPVGLAGKRKGRPASGPLQEHPQQVVPHCVSTVFCKTLPEAELPGLEGRCVRARQYRNSVAQLVVLAGIEWGAQALGLDLFFFFDRLGLALIFGLLIIRL